MTFQKKINALLLMGKGRAKGELIRNKRQVSLKSQLEALIQHENSTTTSIYLGRCNLGAWRGLTRQQQ